MLNIGDVEKARMLNSFYEDRSTKDSQTRKLQTAIRKWISSDHDTRVLVTHQVNISALTGRYAGSGDMLLVTIQDNDVVVLASVPTPASQ